LTHCSYYECTKFSPLVRCQIICMYTRLSKTAFLKACMVHRPVCYPTVGNTVPSFVAFNWTTDVRVRPTTTKDIGTGYIRTRVFGKSEDMNPSRMIDFDKIRLLHHHSIIIKLHDDTSPDCYHKEGGIVIFVRLIVIRIMLAI